MGFIAWPRGGRGCPGRRSCLDRQHGPGLRASAPVPPVQWDVLRCSSGCRTGRSDSVSRPRHHWCRGAADHQGHRRQSWTSCVHSWAERLSRPRANQRPCGPGPSSGSNRMNCCCRHDGCCSLGGEVTGAISGADAGVRTRRISEDAVEQKGESEQCRADGRDSWASIISGNERLENARRCCGHRYPVGLVCG